MNGGWNRDKDGDRDWDGDWDRDLDGDRDGDGNGDWDVDLDRGLVETEMVIGIEIGMVMRMGTNICMGMTVDIDMIK